MVARRFVLLLLHACACTALFAGPRGLRGPVQRLVDDASEAGAVLAPSARPSAHGRALADIDLRSLFKSMLAAQKKKRDGAKSAKEEEGGLPSMLGNFFGIPPKDIHIDPTVTATAAPDATAARAGSKAAKANTKRAPAKAVKAAPATKAAKAAPAAKAAKAAPAAKAAKAAPAAKAAKAAPAAKAAQVAPGAKAAVTASMAAPVAAAVTAPPLVQAKAAKAKVALSPAKAAKGVSKGVPKGPPSAFSKALAAAEASATTEEKSLEAASAAAEKKAAAALGALESSLKAETRSTTTKKPLTAEADAATAMAALAGMARAPPAKVPAAATKLPDVAAAKAKPVKAATPAVPQNAVMAVKAAGGKVVPARPTAKAAKAVPVSAKAAPAAKQKVAAEAKAAETPLETGRSAGEAPWLDVAVPPSAAAPASLLTPAGGAAPAKATGHAVAVSQAPVRGSLLGAIPFLKLMKPGATTTAPPAPVMTTPPQSLLGGKWISRLRDWRLHTSAQSHQPGHGPWLALDGKPQTTWYVDADHGMQWLVIDMLSARTLSALEIDSTSPCGIDSAKWQSAASATGPWTTVKAVTMPCVIGGVAKKQRADFPVTTSRYWRLELTRFYAFGGQQQARKPLPIAELRFFGAEDTSTRRATAEPTGTPCPAVELRGLTKAPGKQAMGVYEVQKKKWAGHPVYKLRGAKLYLYFLRSMHMWSVGHKVGSVKFMLLAPFSHEPTPDLIKGTWSEVRGDDTADVAVQPSCRRGPLPGGPLPGAKVTTATATAAAAAKAPTKFACVQWRQTGNCDPQGVREPAHDRGCVVVVTSFMSGYCECEGGLKRSAVGCGHKSFTCNAACAQPLLVSEKINIAKKTAKKAAKKKAAKTAAKKAAKKATKKTAEVVEKAAKKAASKPVPTTSVHAQKHARAHSASAAVAHKVAGTVAASADVAVEAKDAGAVELTMELHMILESIEGWARREQFCQYFEHDVSTALGVAATRVKVLDLAPGSVKVFFRITAPPAGSASDLPQLVDKLNAALQAHSHTTSPLWKGRVTQLLDNAVPLAPRYVSRAAMALPPPELKIGASEIKLHPATESCGTLDLTNSGKRALVVFALWQEGQPEGQRTDWLLLPPGSTFPLTLAPGAKRSLALKCDQARFGSQRAIVRQVLRIAHNGQPAKVRDASRHVQVTARVSEFAESGGGGEAKGPSLLAGLAIGAVLVLCFIAYAPPPDEDKEGGAPAAADDGGDGDDDGGDAKGIAGKQRSTALSMDGSEEGGGGELEMSSFPMDKPATMGARPEAYSDAAPLPSKPPPAHTLELVMNAKLEPSAFEKQWKELSAM